jgi:hypothetical protein
MNPGNIVGYNVNYSLESSPVWDISNVSTLTWRLALNGAEDSVLPLPIQNKVVVVGKIVRVIV